MEMTILPRADNVTHVVLQGRFDTIAAEDISESLSQATASRERTAIVDLSQIDFMASRGIGVLLANANRLRKLGHMLVLLSPQPLVESSLRISRIDAVMPIAFSLDEAIRIAQGDHIHSRAATPSLDTSPGVNRAPRSGAEPTVRAVAEGELKLAIGNELSELANVHAAFGRFLDAHDISERAAYAVNLAVDELVVNVMRYAYVDDETHTIDLKLATRGDQVILNIVDDGRPFDPRTGPALDLHAEEREAGGLGLILVLDMVDTLKYQRVHEKNCVEVRVRLCVDVTEGNSDVATT